jgi:aminopeptidase C
MLGNYEDALIVLDGLMDYVPEGFPSWFKNREIAAVTNLYAENYQASWDLVQMALNHERFKIISEVDQETWRLYFGYLHFIGKVENKSYWDNDDQSTSRFRLSRLMNEMPNYTQDKRGGNIPLLILQVLFLLSDLKEHKDNFDMICNKIDAIKKYSSRNLDEKSEHFRSDCFINLLGLLPKHLHNPKTLIKTAHNTLHSMSTVQAEVVDNSFEVEVVPYERQWAWIMYYVEQAASK